MAVIISRLPFIWNSPGTDPDNWLVLSKGQKISETGLYEASRLPGYPVSEYLSSFFGTDAWWVLNVVTVLFSALSMVYFYKILNSFNLKNKLIATIALAFTQGIFIASTVNMEYMWSLFFLLAGIFNLLNRKYLVSGILIGLMISTRFTNIVLLLPLLYLIIYLVKEKKAVNIFYFLLTSALTFGVCFIPVFRTYGLDFFPSEIWGLPDIKTIVSFYTLYLYGVLGLVGLMIAVLFVLKNSRKVSEKAKQYKSLFIFCGLNIAITSAVYFRFPFESYYNLPLIPFLIIILNIVLFSEKIKKTVFLLLILSPFLLHVNMSKVHLEGSVFVTEKMETDIWNYTHQLHQKFSEKNTRRKVLVCGGFYYAYNYLYPQKITAGKVLLRPSEEEIKYYLSRRYTIYYPSDITDELKNIKNYDITKYGESLLPALNEK
ncbi:glycosyltransferase family 39 protein [Chryseobacterium sp. MYb264]|uniref:glycosyltransferase family 39 protein n=1 Tax=Chryseobacterium sp. MYb264 TaxID=2745153 RepID=UPI002E10998E|nr:glycosyltransferase family 39 protein [Chryseobacterium sp. MYb264]